MGASKESMEENKEKAGEKNWEVPKIVENMIPVATAPVIDSEKVSVLLYIRRMIDKNEEAVGITSLPNDTVQRMNRLYGFDRISPTRWNNLEIWDSRALPDGTLYVRAERNPVYQEEPIRKSYYLVRLETVEKEIERIEQGQSISDRLSGLEEKTDTGSMLSPRTRAKVDAIASHYGMSIETVLRSAIDEYYLIMFPGRTEERTHK